MNTCMERIHYKQIGYNPVVPPLRDAHGKHFGAGPHNEEPKCICDSLCNTGSETSNHNEPVTM